VNQFQQEKYQ